MKALHGSDDLKRLDGTEPVSLGDAAVLLTVFVFALAVATGLLP